ncbi:hypothetical protein AB6A40_009386 [Gnathostoma spinigerum]|uniref:SH3 domain-containing protein n=1 Tax=Gnathostoma spinigerum TaxID=75299 RepID=A0ABD6EU92_9BILA
MRQNDEIASFISRSVSSHVPASDRYERICLQRNDKISNAIPSCSSSLENGRPETAASAEDVRSPRSRATKPFVQVQPNPRPYHRSASEYHYVASESPRYQQFHNAPSGVTSQTHQRVFSERECHTKPSVTPTSMTSSFLTAQSSMSLDPIPLMTSSPKLHGLSSKSSSNERDHNLTRDRPSSLTRNEMIDQNVPMVRSAERDVGNSQGSSSVDTANRTGRIPPASRTDRSVQGTGITRANTVHQIEMNSKPWAPRDPLNIDNHPTQVASQGIKKSRAPPLPPVTSGLKFKPPIPVPRRTSTMSKPPIRTARRCRALYDCEADNPDELSFRQGDTIVVSKEKIAGENDTWMEGYLLNNPQTRGMFPVTFVTFIS